MRHQQGLPYTNCLSKRGLSKCSHIAKGLRGCRVSKIHTCFVTNTPSGDKHVRPLQTASVIGTYLNIPVEQVALDALPKASYDEDILIVWHHGDIQAILRHYTNDTTKFSWDETNYEGCIVIRSPFDWVFHRHYFSKPIRFLNCFLR